MHENHREKIRKRDDIEWIYCKFLLQLYDNNNINVYIYTFGVCMCVITYVHTSYADRLYNRDFVSATVFLVSLKLAFP